MAYNKNSWQDGDIITAEKLNHMEDGIEAAGGLTNDVKTALLQIAEKVAYIDEHGQDYYDDLYDALYPPASLVSISAVYTQSGTVYPTTSLSALKDDLVVTAYYDDTSSEAVPAADYMLSGALTVGTSVITASYNGKTATFNVTVSAVPTVSSISAVYTQSGTVYDTDSLDSLKADLAVTATYSDTTTATVPSADYTLSGTLTVGTSTITVSYEGKTTSFSVTVSKYALYPFENGTHTFSNGSSVTITSGHHVKISLATYNDGTSNFMNLSDVSENTNTSTTTGNIQQKTTKFTIQSGQTAVMTVSNFTSNRAKDSGIDINGYQSGTNTNIGMAIQKLTSAGGTATKTFTDNTNVGCIFAVPAGNSTETSNPLEFEFDVSFVVDGVRYV